MRRCARSLFAQAAVRPYGRGGANRARARAEVAAEGGGVGLGAVVQAAVTSSRLRSSWNVLEGAALRAAPARALEGLRRHCAYLSPTPHRLQKSPGVGCGLGAARLLSELCVRRAAPAEPAVQVAAAPLGRVGAAGPAA